MRQSERRRSQRVRLAAVAALETLGSRNANNQALCVVRNVSRNGIGLETGQPPLVGQGVILRLVINDETHELRTRASRVKQRGQSHFYEVGLDWSACPAEDLQFLDQYLAAIEADTKA